MISNVCTVCEYIYIYIYIIYIIYVYQYTLMMMMMIIIMMMIAVHISNQIKTTNHGQSIQIIKQRMQLKLNQNATFDASRTAWPAVQGDNVFWLVLRLKDQEDLDTLQEIQDDVEVLLCVQFYLNCDGVIAFMHCGFRFQVWQHDLQDFSSFKPCGCGGQTIVDP